MHTFSVRVAEDKDRGDDGPHAAEEFVVSWKKSRKSEETGDYFVAQETANAEQNAVTGRLADVRGLVPGRLPALFYRLCDGAAHVFLYLHLVLPHSGLQGVVFLA